ncbi:MAG TPA: hypothetical protein VH044_04185 [Polyangiaceae bacterium]|nr:hypothetical protein [Polyangiaceae bacterium]
MLAPNAARVAEPRRPGLIQIAWQFLTKGSLQFFMDQWRAQGDLPWLMMGRSKLLLVIHPDHVRHVLVTGRQGFEKLETCVRLGTALVREKATAGSQEQRRAVDCRSGGARGSEIDRVPPPETIRSQ